MTYSHDSSLNRKQLSLPSMDTNTSHDYMNDDEGSPESTTETTATESPQITDAQTEGSTEIQISEGPKSTTENLSSLSTEASTIDGKETSPATEENPQATEENPQVTEPPLTTTKPELDAVTPPPATPPATGSTSATGAPTTTTEAPKNRSSLSTPNFILSLAALVPILILNKFQNN